MKRRSLITFGLIGAAFALQASRDPLLERFGGLPELAPLDRPKGFRKLEGGGLSGPSLDPFIGLEAPQDIQPLAIEESALLAHLFGKDIDQNRVPIAYFTDYNCPYCRVLGNDLDTLAAELPDQVQLIWHELPLLGPGSIIGAKAALAAGKQGRYAEMHQRLNTGVVRINAGFIALLSEELGLDHDRLVQDMESEAVTRQLRLSKGVAQWFAVIGTPFLVAGRTAVSGRISPRHLRQLVKLEAAEQVERRHSGFLGRSLPQST